MSLNSSSAEPPARIRLENANSGDESAAIRIINEEAFGGCEEADLVDNLRGGDHVLLSLVAEVDGLAVGHILFSRMWIHASSGRTTAVALAPMAVVPGHQRKGIGTLLVQCGLERLRAQQEEIVIVV